MSRGQPTLINLTCAPDVISLHDSDIYQAASDMLKKNMAGLSKDLMVQKVDVAAAGVSITVKCQSYKKAKSVIDQINKLQHKFKIKASFPTERDEMLKNSMEQIRNQVRHKLHDTMIAVLEKHQEKLDEEKRIGNLHKAQGMAVENYDMITAFQRLHQDKYQELLMQRNEYEQYCNMLGCEIQNAEKKEKLDRIENLHEAETKKIKAALPIYSKKSDIISQVLQHNALVIVGETGSGKSTQTPQYLCQTSICDTGLIACVQPRKLAALSLAHQVAQEMGSHVGDLVGCKAGFHNKQNSHTKIMYMTNHAMLKECVNDPMLSKYSCVIVDEAHERSIYCDLLLGMVKDTMKHRSDLKVIIMSATIDPVKFVKYFNNCPVLHVPGRTFPVEVVYKTENEPIYDDSKYLIEAVEKAVQVHQTEPLGDILVFLTTPVETEKAVEMFQLRAGDRVKCLPLHGRLQPQEQQQVFNLTPQGQQKVVFATNAAETSITLPGIKYVIDTGKAKEMKYDSTKGINTLDVQMISQSSADQRKGRAGRTSSGKCFRLYTEDEYNSMAAGSVPDLLKSHLSMAFLTLMEMGIENPLKFHFVETPPEETMLHSMKELRELGALCPKGGLNDFGKKLAKLSIEPRYGKMLFDAVDEGIPFDIMVIIGLLSIGANIFFCMGTEEERQKADTLKMRFCHPMGDLMTMYTVYKEWISVDKKKKSAWCVENSINAKSMCLWHDVIKDLQKTLKQELKITIRCDFSEAVDFTVKISRLLLRCYKTNLSCFTGHTRVGYFVGSLEAPVTLHPSSALLVLKQETTWLVYTNILVTGRQYLMNVTSIDESLIEGELGKDVMTAIRLSMEDRYCILQTIEAATAGPSVLKQFIGRKGANVNALKADIEKKYLRDVPYALDITLTSCKVILACAAAVAEGPLALIRDCINKIKHELNEVTMEEKFHPGADIRYVMQKGATLQTILMTEDYRTIILKQIPLHVEDEKIIELFSKYGPMRIHKFNNKGNPPKNLIWGKIVYDSEKNAKEVMANYENKTDISMTHFRLEVEKVQPQPEPMQSSKITVTWVKRFCKGLGFVKFHDADHATLAYYNLAGSRNGLGLTFRKSRKDECEVVIQNVPRHATEEEVGKVVRDLLLQPEDSYSIILILEKDQPVTAGKVKEVQKCLTEKIRDESQETNFRLEMKHPKVTDFTWLGFIHTPDLQTAEKICNICNGTVEMMSTYVKFDLQLSVLIQINTQMLSKLQPLYFELIEHVHRTYKGVTLRFDKHRFTHREVLFLQAPDVYTYREVSVLCNGLVCGRLYKVHNHYDLAILFSLQGRKFLQELEKEMNCVMEADQQHQGVRIFGQPERQDLACKKIQEFLDQNQNHVNRQVELTGSDRPPGLMKYLITTYGTDLEKFVAKTNLDSAELMLRRHTVSITGSEDAVAKALEEIEQVVQIVSKQPNIQVLGNECSICLCPITGKLYNLECCGHPYCYDCMIHMFINAADRKDLPIKCAKEGCDADVVIKDIQNIVDKKNNAFNKLVKAAVDVFITANKERYKYCLTPNCGMVYRAASRGKVFTCPSCNVRICRSCHSPEHKGIACAIGKLLGENDKG